MRFNLLIRFAGIFLIIASVFIISGCEKKADTGAKSELKVGMECAYAPFNWTQTDDSHGAVAISGGGYAAGYDVEIAKKIADGLGMTLVIVKTEWDGLLPAVTSGKIDAIIAGMSPLPERLESIDFSESYYNSDLVVVVSKDGPYAGAANLADLSGARITAQLNTFHYTVIDQIPGVVKETAMDEFPTMIASLNAGKIDGYVSERPGAVAASVSNPNLSFIVFDDGFSYTTEDTAIAVGLKKGSELTAKINQILSGITESERNRLMDTAVSQHPALD